MEKGSNLKDIISLLKMAQTKKENIDRLQKVKEATDDMGQELFVSFNPFNRNDIYSAQIFLAREDMAKLIDKEIEREKIQIVNLLKEAKETADEIITNFIL